MPLNNAWKCKYRILTVCGVVLLLVSCVFVFRFADGNFRIALTTHSRSVPKGTASIACVLKNPTFHIVEYGAPFSLEYLSDGKWTEIREGKEINFELWAKVIIPFASAKITYPVSLFSSLEKPGDYRIVIKVSIKQLNEPNKRLGEEILYCPFTVY